MVDQELRAAIETCIGLPTHSIVEGRPLPGGSINRAFYLRSKSGATFFVKTHPSPPPLFYQREAEGLAALAAATDHGGPAIPRGLGLDLAGRFLVLEYLPEDRHRDYAALGRALGALHNQSNARWGWATSNYLGTTEQRNDWAEDWWEFWHTRRLLPQVQMARDSGYLSQAECQAAERLGESLSQRFAGSEGLPALCHGDLWAGNHWFSGGQAYLIDPAVYFGAAETDLAMTELFGGYPREFYQAYWSDRPKVPGFPERREIYNLYHNLNHLNLFGLSYLEACRSVWRSYQ